MLEVLPKKTADIISSRLDEDRVYEIRLRANKPVTVNYDGRFRFLTMQGLGDDPTGAVVCEPREIEETVMRASRFSLYAENEKLVKGYLTIDGGIRIGVCGEVVGTGKNVVTIKNFTSLCMRIPHEIEGAGKRAFDSVCADNTVHSALIIAPPAAGKTTVLRDLCRLISDETRLNVLLVDERCEIAAVKNGVASLNVGKTTDIVSNCDKTYAFSYGIRSMRPDVIVTDELCGDDAEAIKLAVYGGVKAIASVHAPDLDYLRRKAGLKELAESGVFERYVVLSNRLGAGTYEGIYDGEFRPIRDGYGT